MASETVEAIASLAADLRVPTTAVVFDPAWIGFMPDDTFEVEGTDLVRI